MSSTTLLAKLGGAPLGDDQQRAIITADLAALEDARLVVVHGGGPQATALAKRLGLEPNIVGGRRVTDAETLEVMKMVLAGQLNVDLTCALREAGLRAVGLSGVSADLIAATRRPPRVVSGGGDEPIDFGHVGDITGVGTDLLSRLLDGGYTPVLNSLGADDAGHTFNINADIAATRVARSIRADHLLLLTGGVPGVLRDRHDPDTRIPRLTIAEARAAIAEGVIQGGMIPKLEESFQVLGDGVGAIHILGALSPGDIGRAINEPGSVGTALLP